MTTDPQATVEFILKVVELVSVVGGGGYAVFRLGRTTQRFEAIAELQAKQIIELKDDVKEMRKVLTQVALQDARLTNMSERMNNFENRLSDLSHGRGFIDTEVRRASTS